MQTNIIKYTIHKQNTLKKKNKEINYKKGKNSDRLLLRPSWDAS